MAIPADYRARRFPARRERAIVGGVSPSSRRWSDEQILRAIREDAGRRGRLPSIRDWEKATADRPTSQTVKNRFGSWGRGIYLATGFKPRRGGGHRAERCRNGHPYAEVNTLVYGGQRLCRTCANRRAWENSRRRREARLAAGLCSRCGGARDDPALKTCARCRRTERKRRRGGDSCGGGLGLPEQCSPRVRVVQVGLRSVARARSRASAW
jgi:Homing endonuclease associated repeat